MANVAVNGSEITPATKSGHVTYDIERYVCVDWDEETGECISRSWRGDGSGSTGAKVTTGTISANSKMKINGTSVAKVGDTVNYSWVADPPVPSNTTNTRYVNISPATSGSGTGTITGGSNKGKLGGQSIALVGSEVSLDIGVTTTISDGVSKMKFNS